MFLEKVEQRGRVSGPQEQVPILLSQESLAHGMIEELNQVV